MTTRHHYHQHHHHHHHHRKHSLHSLASFVLLVTTATFVVAWLHHPVDGFHLAVPFSSSSTLRHRHFEFDHQPSLFLPQHEQKSSHLFLASYSDNDGSSHRADGGAPWGLRNDFETFLNQCSIQSFLFLLHSLRDGHSAFWIDQFTQPVIADEDLPSGMHDDPMIPLSERCKLLHYHGLAALNSTLFPAWDVYFGQLLERPIATYTIKSGRSYAPDYEVEINPASLCSRVLSVREQIAREFVHDLTIIANMGTKAMHRYLQNRKQSTSGMQSKTRLDTTTTNRKDEEEDGNRLLEREDLTFLGIPTNSNAGDPSPLRKGNFDLLLLLATQESIHRVLNSLTADKDKSNRYYLQNFYAERLFSHFIGNQRYGRADDFLDELLRQSPRLVLHHPSTTLTRGDQTKNDDDDDNDDFVFSIMSAMVDPLYLVQMILDQREKVALEWKEEAALVPLQHMSIKRMQLNLLMGRPANMTSSSL